MNEETERLIETIKRFKESVSETDLKNKIEYVETIRAYIDDIEAYLTIKEDLEKYVKLREEFDKYVELKESVLENK